mmetsp:Transcript_12748/g.23898  ORF Transcript_12748/g.23898 Transcript_12748/m.23898 type:complete len:472 (+) Transcript_12748:126-1541(+)
MKNATKMITLSIISMLCKKSRHTVAFSTISSPWFSSSRRSTSTTTRLNLPIQNKLHYNKYVHRNTSLRKMATDTQELTELKRLVEDAKDVIRTNLETVPNRGILEQQITDLEKESSHPDFWNDPSDPRTKRVTQELNNKNKLLERLKMWDKLSEECATALELVDDMKKQTSTSGNDAEDEEMMEMIVEECKVAAKKLLDDGKKYELESLLNGQFDDKPARLILTAGAGGTEACDWVDMLHRMYLRHAERMEYKAVIQEKTAGDVVGYKSVEILIEGTNAYGWFRGEKGAHRLVRLSPFNANNKRQTTFAGVDVIPVLEDEEVEDIDIPESELEITTMRSGGKGGQNVNKVESGVRIKHIPTGINVKCTQERSQHLNRDIAMKRVKAQLLALAQEQRCEEINAIRGDAVEAAWGAQVRNYVLQPYKMIKDQRTNWETSDAQGFLDGNLEDCIGELLRARSREEQIASDEVIY